MAFFHDGKLTPATITITDTLFRNAMIEFRNTTGFANGSTVSIRVTICDRSSNCASLDYSFLVVGTLTTAATIIPDGYWIDDPNRALEIRDIPVGWTVRIFDTAGSQVRKFTNDGVGDVDWAWDFTNEHGLRVVKSLYLIRVLDNTGTVRRSGRFVVQSDL